MAHDTGRIVVLCGLAGSGKTSTAKTLKEHGWIYFEGDVWSWGDPVSQAEETPTPEMIAKARENAEKMKAIMAMGAEFYARVNAGEEGSYEAANAFYDLMMADVLKVKHENPGKDIVVVHAINHKKIRDHLFQCLEKDGCNKVSMVCLDVPHDALKRRNLYRLESRAKADGKTLQKFIMDFPGHNLPAEYEARLEQLTSPGVLKLEPLGDDEKNVHFIHVSGVEDQAGVDKKVLDVLRMKEPE
ncbi:unnamed protein product [Symbiodinium natans]|uniref:Uncharacterized protein n=1 Tax=Symbiodinium natans TaxID=878477 RepID=A0A812MR16_9DINO|nr:unnamed protein product [Symbiodinium natans]